MIFVQVFWMVIIMFVREGKGMEREERTRIKEEGKVKKKKKVKVGGLSKTGLQVVVSCTTCQVYSLDYFEMSTKGGRR